VAEKTATANIQRAEGTIAALGTTVSQLDASPAPDLETTALVASVTAAVAAAEATAADLATERDQAEATSEAALAALANLQTSEETASAREAALVATVATGATFAADPGPENDLATARAAATAAVATTTALGTASAAQETRVAAAEASGAALATEAADARATATSSARLTIPPPETSTATVIPATVTTASTATVMPSTATPTIDGTGTAATEGTRTAGLTAGAALRAELATSQAVATALVAANNALSTAQAATPRAELATSQAVATALVAANNALSTAQAASPVAIEPELGRTGVGASPAATPGSEGDAVLYVADATTGWAGWSLPPGWSESEGMLVIDGGGRGEWLLPPFAVEDRDDYAVEAEIQLNGDPECERNAGLAARGGDESYVAAGAEWACLPSLRLWSAQGEIGRVAADLTPGWHTYRLEVRGATARLSIDGMVVLSGPAGTATGGQVAVWSNDVPLSLRAFRVVEVASP